MNRNVVIKSEYAPIIMHPEGRGYFLNWDYQPSYEDDGNGNEVEAEHGTCLTVFAPYRKPTVNLAKYLINQAYNDDTNKKIYNGFKWNGDTVYLTTENQLDYKAQFDMALQTDGSNLPVKIKVGSDEDIEESKYIVFDNIEDFKAFHYASLRWISQCVNEGWEKKDAVDYSVFEEALKNVPDLPEDQDVLTNRL